MFRYLLCIILSLFVQIAFTETEENLGKKTYELSCQNCHKPQLAKAIKAPAAFDKQAWQLRFQQAKKESEKDPTRFPSAMDYLLYSVTIGKGLMQHGGLCNEADVENKDCSKEALTAAIEYMSGPTHD